MALVVQARFCVRFWLVCSMLLSLVVYARFYSSVGLNSEGCYASLFKHGVV